MPDTMLIIEDEPLLGSELARHYRREGWDVIRALSIEKARTLLLEREIDPLVVLADMSLPDGNALDLLEEVGGRIAGEWLFLTGYGTVAESVRALRLGAFDFLEKPCPTERLNLVASKDDPLSLVKGGAVDKANKAIVSIENYLQLNGQVEGRKLLDDFYAAPYGWTKDTTRYLVAA